MRVAEEMPRSWGCFLGRHEWGVVFEPVLVDGKIDHYRVLYEQCKNCGKVVDAHAR